MANLLKGWGLSILFLFLITVVFFFIQNYKSERMEIVMDAFH